MARRWLYDNRVTGGVWPASVADLETAKAAALPRVNMLCCVALEQFTTERPRGRSEHMIRPVLAVRAFDPIRMSDDNWRYEPQTYEEGWVGLKWIGHPGGGA